MDSMIDQTKFRTLYENLTSIECSSEIAKINASQYMHEYLNLIGFSSCGIIDSNNTINLKNFTKIDPKDKTHKSFDVILFFDAIERDNKHFEKIINQIFSYSNNIIFFSKITKTEPFCRRNTSWDYIEFENFVSQFLHVEEHVRFNRGKDQILFCSKRKKTKSVQSVNSLQKIQEIRDEDITFVVHGAIIDLGRPFERQFTRICIDSIKKLYPSSKIILSTWLDYDPKYIDTFEVDKAVFSCDPGGLTINSSNSFSKASNVMVSNVNRHIKSSLAGLKEVKTNFACCIRSDLEFINNNLIKNYIKYKAHVKPDIFDMPIAVESNGTKKARSFFATNAFLLHVCDFAYFGTTKDLVNLFEIPLESEKNMIYFLENSYPKMHLSFYQRIDTYFNRYVPETYVILMYLKKINILRENDYPNRFHNYNSKSNEIINNKIVLNNFILLDTNQYGFQWLPLPNIMWKTVLLDQNSRFTFDDWYSYVTTSKMKKLFYKGRAFLRRSLYFIYSLSVIPMTCLFKFATKVFLRLLLHTFSIQNLRKK